MIRVYDNVVYLEVEAKMTFYRKSWCWIRGDVLWISNPEYELVELLYGE